MDKKEYNTLKINTRITHRYTNETFRVLSIDDPNHYGGGTLIVKPLNDPNPFVQITVLIKDIISDWRLNTSYEQFEFGF